MKLHSLITPLLALLLAACQPSENTCAVPYGAVNHTDIGIAAIVINGEGTVLAPPMHGQAGGACCAVVPRNWTPGLSATIKWQEDGHWKRGDKGQFIYDKNGDKLFIEGAWKTRTVPIPRYDGDGDFYVFFFPGDDVRVAITSSPEWHVWYESSTEDKAEQDRRFGKRSQ
jgi:hypothetical protein